MIRIRCGGAEAAVEVGNDAIGRATVRGLIAPSNVAALSARVLEAAAAGGAIGVLIAVDRALVALPPVDARFYRYIAPGLGGIPGALLISPEQTPAYAPIPSAAATRGAMRRAFLSPAEAEGWLREQAHSLNANRAWWSLRR